MQENNDENPTVLVEIVDIDGGKTSSQKFSIQDFAFRLYGHSLLPQDHQKLHDLIQQFPFLKLYVLDTQTATLHQLCHYLDDMESRAALLPVIHSLVDIDSSCLLVQDGYCEIPLISLFDAMRDIQDPDPLLLDLMERMIQAQPSSLAHTNHHNGCTILHTLITLCNPPEVVRRILAHSPNLAGSLNRQRQLPLHLASKMEQGSNNGRSYFQSTAMETIRLLVEANPTGILTKDVHDNTPLHYACCNPHLPMEAIQLMANTQPNALTILSNQRLPYHAYVIAEQDKVYHYVRSDKRREDMIAMMRLHTVHGLEHVLLLLSPEPNTANQSRPIDFTRRRPEPHPPAFLACARDLLKQELLVREELRWTTFVKTELPQGKSPFAAADIFWYWTKERKKRDHRQLQTIKLKLRAICCGCTI